MNHVSRVSVGKRSLVVVVTVVMSILVSSSIAASSVFAAPKGIFAKFAQCPTSVPGVVLCQYAEVTGGELTIGSVRVPIDKTIVLQGGTFPAGRLNLYFLLPAANGESISPTELDVPGGLRTIIGCPDSKGRGSYWTHFGRDACHGFSHGREHGDRVTMTLEGVANQSNPAILDLAAFIFEEGTGLVFPGRLHLKNALLGEECFIGSEAHPIELHFTAATTSPPPPNQPITGKVGELGTTEEGGYEVNTTTNTTLVDNSFSIPPAEGCGANPHLASILDTRIDQTLGLESPAGRNTAILTGTHRLATAKAVLASEQFPTAENPPPPPHEHHHPHHHWWPGR